MSSVNAQPGSEGDDAAGLDQMTAERLDLPGSELRVEDLVKIFETPEGPVRAVDEVTFTVEPGVFYTLLGPSGCGKSTTLRCVAGLERPDGGSITVAGTVVASHHPKVSVPTPDRELGMVFQSYAIWPHMTVRENVAFPLRAANRNRRVPRREVGKRVEEALAMVRLDGYASRSATKLSGGQQQRLALARALVLRPKLLLLDEPLSNLDAGLREHMRSELRSMQRRTGVTTLYVTHDQSEAFSMSNTIAVMEAGKIVQQAPPREVYARPATAFVATFVGKTNLLSITSSPQEAPRGGEAVALGTGAGKIVVAPENFRPVQDDSAIVVRPEDVGLSAKDVPARAGTLLRGRIRRSTFLGESVEFEVSVGNEILVSRQHSRVLFDTDDDVYVDLPADRCVVVSGAVAGVGAHVRDDDAATDHPAAGGRPARVPLDQS